MAHLWKLQKPSPLQWISRVGQEEVVRLINNPTFNGRNALCCAKIPNLPPRRGFCSKESHITKSASVGSQLGSLKSSCFHHRMTLCWVKTSSLVHIRGFCTDKTPKDLQAISRSPRVVAEAQAALVDYLHSTRGLQFPDAEQMSKHSPNFLAKLLKKVENEEDTARALTRFFRYHPINEFEPFFEGMGLKPSEFNSFLPRDLMFLSDNEKMLENYHVLCNYGIARGKIGKIYKEATEIFSYEPGILGSKLQAYEGLGLSKTSIIKIVASSPILLVGDVNRKFVKVLEWLEDIGIQLDWIWGILSEKNSYDWSRMLVILQYFTELGFTNQEFGALIRKHPDFLLDGSGKMVLLVSGLLLKLGGTKKELFGLFSQFPDVQIGSFMKNMRRGLIFLIEIEMDPGDIQRLLLTHTEVFGSYSLKKANSILTYLNVGRKRLCRIIKDDPHQLKKYVLGLKLNRLPNSGESEKSLGEKKKFLLRLGFVEKSKEMEKALKVFRGKGSELQDRYDFLVKTGLDPNDVSNMIKLAPQILNQKIDVLQSKIDFLVNNLGYPLSSLIAFPAYMSYTVERVKLRFLMYTWLRDRGKARPSLALSSFLACSDKIFAKRWMTGRVQSS
ncbi:transcription termination factor MTEF18, mitochondrial-like isoform X2 [Phoenix dactylifera]|uniref:Transcription termination factor MTEF18, mitochondrial-like isoform X2 n=1 Tax=Phoenix dactylifera TaxID=42345 RepID=A0A8B7BI18_PHODC|nr:transcription termination factor MTEF18, mitochondrial-like isoform X2 [Phoenix dactylifera]